MFFMRVVGVAEIVLHRYGLDNPFDSFLAEGSDAGCNDCEAAKQMLAKLVVERTNLSVLVVMMESRFIGITC